MKIGQCGARLLFFSYFQQFHHLRPAGEFSLFSLLFTAGRSALSEQSSKEETQQQRADRQAEVESG